MDLAADPQGVLLRVPDRAGDQHKVPDSPTVGESFALPSPIAIASLYFGESAWIVRVTLFMSENVNRDGRVLIHLWRALQRLAKRVIHDDPIAWIEPTWAFIVRRSAEYGRAENGREQDHTLTFRTHRHPSWHPV
jgi:hypothetical protein